MNSDSSRTFKTFAYFNKYEYNMLKLIKNTLEKEGYMVSQSKILRLAFTEFIKNNEYNNIKSYFKQENKNYEKQEWNY